MDSLVTSDARDQAKALEQAIQDHQAGRVAAAEAGYRDIVGADPCQPDAWHLLAMLACDRGEVDNARILLDTAIGLDPVRGAFHNTRARALALSGDLAAAETAYHTAWALRPDTPEIANNLGTLLLERGDLAGAEFWLSRASTLAPDLADIAANLADVMVSKGEIVGGLMHYRDALRLSPDRADIRSRLGKLLLSLGRLGEAEQSYRAALQRQPDDAPIHNNLGLVMQAQGRSDAAMRCFHDALRHDPHCADAHYNIGCLSLLENRLDAARDCQISAIQAAPLHGAALWARCMVELPIIYETSAQVPVQRARYREQLAALVRKAADPAVARALAATIGASQPFFLPYQGESDIALQSVYGELVARLLQTETPAPAAPPTAGEPIRIGIVSGFFSEHTIWRLFLKGWLSQLDRSQFHIHAYHTGQVEDDQTTLARGLCHRFVGGRGVDIRSAILTDRPHVLLYPELGMDPIAIRLAAERLARVQCVAWGQPETSGLPTIDYFLSAAMMEPEDPAAHYSEHLLALPNLGIYYTTDERQGETCTREQLGLRQDAVLFWCGQALSKYLPESDDVFARIAAEVGDCQFLFIGFASSHAITACFQQRLRLAFAARGLLADQHCVFVTPMSQERFLGSVRLADIMLDSIGWSGGKSTLDALAEAPVIVTYAGKLMRGRHTAAILTRIGVTETIAHTLDDYVAIAVRLAANPAERAALRTRVAAGRHRAMADTAPIRALESFLIQATTDADLPAAPYGPHVQP